MYSSRDKGVGLETIVNNICWKDNWRSKIYDQSIVNKWCRESVSQNVSVDVFEMALSVLKSIAEKSLVKDSNYCQEYMAVEDQDQMTDLDGCDDWDDWDEKDKSGYCKHQYRKPLLQEYITEEFNLIPSNLTQELAKLLSPFEENQDWHPGSNRQVLDLIHPSLYCYVKGLSSLHNVSKSQSPGTTKEPITEQNRYQWLPAEVNINSGTKFMSYINNLDPLEHRELYQVIEQIFTKMIPGLETVINKQLPQNIQVIVKAANIVLTPENPVYPGGSWHLEGMAYEHIIATSIYYYQETNLTPSYLEFRRALEDLLHYPQSDDQYVHKHYGLRDEQPMSEYLGKVRTEEGKCLFFPNYLQHHVSSFELKDKTKIGERKILVFFLIDPDKKIISTQDIPMQQRNFLGNQLVSMVKNRFPRELSRKVAEYLPGMTLKEARQYREKLMFQRKYFIDQQNQEIFEREFSLCEH